DGHFLCTDFADLRRLNQGHVFSQSATICAICGYESGPVRQPAIFNRRDRRGRRKRQRKPLIPLSGLGVLGGSILKQLSTSIPRRVSGCLEKAALECERFLVMRCV